MSTYTIMMNATLNASNSSCVMMHPSAGHLLMSFYIIAFVLGLLFNLVTFGPIIQQICRKNILGIYLLSLSVSDILYILTMPLWIYYLNNNHKWTLGQGLCSLAGFIYYSNLYISIFILCCISIDRCLAITFPLRVQAFRRQRYAWIICGLVSVSVMALHCLVLYLDKLEDPLDDSDQRCYETFPMTERIAMFNLIRAGVGFLLPLVVITICYWLISAKVQQSSGVDEQGKRKVRLLSMGVIGIFSFCFAPYHILLMIRSIAFFSVGDQRSCYFEQAMYLPFTCSLGLSSLNSMVDPVLYVLASNGAREDMRLFCWKNNQRQMTGSPLVGSEWKTRVTNLK
ncbi:G protein-coupled receptor 184 isoform X1 [Ctenopharyngodon idella]|uniref:G protein-coupled receptor 184 isoform X1 n=2 Tax=Ctenopharyngodon idella TaxID=7959 RepID=UPI0022305704|nr:G protein-coupled receptor 184 isoform X1 [Ctenopharyngodon idella]XP_051718353.1 G protein-coupled receptor 184 isoform X1 [Ctenopharyngodon idella]